MKTVVISAILLVLGSSSAWAQASRTWVSGVGDDVNPCSRTAPCKTWAGAISKTAAGGEINALDPGGFGAVTITKAITIDGGGMHASSTVAGTNGFIINAGSADRVTLRNISLNGLGSGLRGIYFLGGKSLIIENCVVQNFRGTTGYGLQVATSLASTTSIINSTFAANGHGAVIAPQSSSIAKVVVEKSKFLDNVGAGFRAEGGAIALVHDSVASGNEKRGFAAMAAAGNAIIDIDESVTTANVHGLVAGYGAGMSRINISNTMVGANTNGLVVDAQGAIVSWGNNRIFDNSSFNGVPAGVLPQQ